MNCITPDEYTPGSDPTLVAVASGARRHRHPAKMSIELPHLEALLRESMDKEVTLESYKTESLLPPGENYMSTIYRVDAVIKRKSDSPKEQLQLVAKMLPTAEFQRSRMHAATIFGKEIFMIEKLSRAYQDIERRFNVGDVNNLFPRFYGAKMSATEENPKQCESDTILLLENIKVLGYDTMDRKKGNFSMKIDCAHSAFEPFRVE